MTLEPGLASIIVAILAFVGTAATLFASKNAQKRTTEIDRLKVVADAYTAAQTINLEIVNQLRKELQHVQALLKDERLVSDRLRESVNGLEVHLQRLEEVVQKSRQESPPSA